MIAARRGISEHLRAEIFERVHTKLTRMGWTPEECTRGATAYTYAVAGDYSQTEKAQVWEATDAILRPLQRTPVDVTSTDQTDMRASVAHGASQ